MPSPNVVQFSSITPTISCLNNNNFYLGVQNQEYGETSETGFWNGITPPSGGYITYYNKLSGGPSINYIPNDADLVSFMYKRFPNDFGSIYQLPEAVRVPVIFSIANTYNDFIILEKDYENIITDDLVLCLDAGFKNSYGGLGTSWRDLSVENNQGTLINGPTYSTDGGGSVVFDGTNDYISEGTIFVNSHTDPFTFAAWFKVGTQTGNSGSILRPFIIQMGTNNGVIIDLSVYRQNAADEGKIRFVVGDGSSVAKSTQAYDDQNWHYAVGVSDGTYITLYIDGQAEGYGITTNIGTPYGVAIGGDIHYNNSRWLLGNIAIASIYNRALTSTEVLQNYNAQKGRFGITDNTEPSTGGAPPPAVSPTPTPTITITPSITPTLTPTITLTPSSTPAPEIVTDSLVFSVDAANTSSYPSSGITWYDLSGDNDGTLVNNPTFDEANGGSIVFDGTDDYVDFGDIGLTLYSINLWCYLNNEVTSQTSYEPLFRFDNTGYQEGVGFGAISGFLQGETLLMLGETNGYTRTGIFDNIPAGWNNITFNWNGSNYDIYLNSNKKTTSSGTAIHVELINSNGLYLGQGYYQSHSYEGKFSNFSIYNRPLTDSEILQNYNALKSRFGFYEDVVTDGLVFAVDAGNTYSYPGSGTTWADLIGDNDGTLVNGPTYDNTNGGSLVFDGTDDYVNTNFILNGSQPLTVSCWFNLNTTTKNWHSIIDAFKDGSDRNFQLWCDNQGKLRVFHLGSPHSGSYTLYPNSWYNAVFTYSGSGLGTLYVNGNITDINVPKGNGSGGDIQLNIGRRTDAAVSSYTNGWISNVKIYNRALTSEEVAQNYNALKDRFGLPNLTPTPTPTITLTPSITSTITPTITLTPSITPTLTPTPTSTPAPSSTPAPEIVTDSLVFSVDAGDINSYPASGTTWYDLVGDNDGTLVNGPTFDSANGGSIVFDGTDDLISFIDSNLYSFGDGYNDSPFTVETWVNFNLIPGSGFTGLISKDSGGSSREWALLVNNTNNYFRVFIKNAGGNNQQSIDATNVTITINSWYHIIATYDGRGGSSSYQGLKLYVNGEEGTVGNIFTQSYTAMSNTNAPVRIASYGGGAFLNGKISNSRIYNRALSSSEVLQNYNALKSRFNL